jgi:predicted permease
MRALRGFFQRIIAFIKQRQNEDRLREEIEAHVALQTAENIRSGLSPAEARRQAVLKFGAVEAIKESYRDQRGIPFLETLIQDVRYTLRRLRSAPAFTVATVLILALGIGATTSIFTLVYAVLLKSLAVANPDELYRLGKEARCCYTGGYSEEKEFSLVSYDLYKYFRDNTKGFTELAAFGAPIPDVGIRRAGTADPAQSFPGEFVSGNYFRMFGLQPYAGRLLTASDDFPAAAPVAVMSYNLWRQRYGADPSVIGSVFDIDEKPFTVVGISPPAFFGDRLSDNPPDFFFPLNTEPYVEANPDLDKIDTHWLDLIGRIRPGASPAAVEAEMRVQLKQWLRSHWGDMSAEDRALFPQQTLFLRPGGAGISTMRDQYEHWLHVLMAVSGFVLLIVSANVANLMLVRGLERRRQTSLSMALGARVGRVVRQALTESVLLSILGGAAGVAIAFAGTRLILHFAFPTAAGTPGIPISASPSIPVLSFAFAVSLLTGVGFGIAPGWMTTRLDPIEALHASNRSTVRTGSLPRKALVVFQAALSLALLAASGLLSVTLYNLENQDFGFDQDRRTVVMASPRLGGYRPNQLTLLYQRIHDSLASIPGVSAVALCTYSPLSGNAWGSAVWVDGRAPSTDNSCLRDRVTAGYFGAVGTPILTGRDITDQDTDSSRHVAVINEAFARKFFKNEDPIGKHFGRDGIGSEREYEIVGIAKDARYLTFDLDKPLAPFFFQPESQVDLDLKTGLPETDSSHFLSDIVVVTKPGASISDAQIRRTLASIDPNLPVIFAHSLKAQVADAFRQQRLIARLTSFFGILSLILCCVGLYGVTAYNAGCRTSEIGLRMALGADRSDAVGLILRGAFALIAIGLLLGLPLTFAAGRFLGHQLYGMNPYNPTVISMALAALGLSGLIASLIPALRASSISPLEALRTE